MSGSRHSAQAFLDGLILKVKDSLSSPLRCMGYRNSGCPWDRRGNRPASQGCRTPFRHRMRPREHQWTDQQHQGCGASASRRGCGTRQAAGQCEASV